MKNYPLNKNENVFCLKQISLAKFADLIKKDLMVLAWYKLIILMEINKTIRDKICKCYVQIVMQFTLNILCFMDENIRVI